MDISKVFQDIAENLNKMGVSIASDPGVTVNEIIELGNDLEVDAIENLLNRLTSYNIFLKSQKGSLEAQIVIKEGEFKRVLYLETQSMPKQSADGVYLTREEKESVVVSTKLKEQSEEVAILKASHARIRDLPWAIDKKIDLLKMKYRRLLDVDRETS